MTTTYDPFDPAYGDAGDLTEELNRVYDLCAGCRLCSKFCDAFPTMFSLIDRHDDQAAAKLTDAERFAVVDECFNCKLCHVNCPYVPGRHDWELDFPRLMLRAKSVQVASSEAGPAIADRVLGAADLLGSLATLAAPIVNPLIDTPGSRSRQVIERITGVSSERILPPYATQRFTTWFRQRRPVVANPAAKQGDVMIVPTCQVEYADVGIAQDFVKVAEHNRIDCSVPEGQRCCGAPLLHAGDVVGFRAAAHKNVRTLAPIIRARLSRGEEASLVVLQPTCSYVMKFDYPDYLDGVDQADAELVAERVFDGAEYLMSIHKADGTALDTEFQAPVPGHVTYHAACHLRAQNIGPKSRDLVALTGAVPAVVSECSGIDGTWGLKASNVDQARHVARKAAAAIGRNLEEFGTDPNDHQVVGDCTLANGGLQLETGAVPIHPIKFLARAYGIPEEE